jgi:phosphopantothenate synthetase
VVKEKKRGKGKENLLEDYDNKENLKEVIGEIASRLKSEGTRK